MHDGIEAWLAWTTSGREGKTKRTTGPDINAKYTGHRVAAELHHNLFQGQLGKWGHYIVGALVQSLIGHFSHFIALKVFKKLIEVRNPHAETKFNLNPGARSERIGPLHFRGVASSDRLGVIWDARSRARTLS